MLAFESKYEKIILLATQSQPPMSSEARTDRGRRNHLKRVILASSDTKSAIPQGLHVTIVLCEAFNAAIPTHRRIKLVPQPFAERVWPPVRIALRLSAPNGGPTTLEPRQLLHITT